MDATEQNAGPTLPNLLTLARVYTDEAAANKTAKALSLPGSTPSKVFELDLTPVWDALESLAGPDGAPVEKVYVVAGNQQRAQSYTADRLGLKAKIPNEPPRVALPPRKRGRPSNAERAARLAAAAGLPQAGDARGQMPIPGVHAADLPPLNVAAPAGMNVDPRLIQAVTMAVMAQLAAGGFAAPAPIRLPVSIGVFPSGPSPAEQIHRAATSAAATPPPQPEKAPDKTPEAPPAVENPAPQPQPQQTSAPKEAPKPDPAPIKPAAPRIAGVPAVATPLPAVLKKPEPQAQENNNSQSATNPAASPNASPAARKLYEFMVSPSRDQLWNGARNRWGADVVESWINDGLAVKKEKVKGLPASIELTAQGRTIARTAEPAAEFEAPAPAPVASSTPDPVRTEPMPAPATPAIPEAQKAMALPRGLVTVQPLPRTVKAPPPPVDI